MVFFVGAGPGAPDLITVRGQRLLEQADVIIYAGSLVNPELLKAAKPSCRVYNSAYMTLEEVISVMETAEAEGKTCVRLHTGDPSLFGAVREQMDELEKRGISYESCPGVSALFGAAASLNLEYTLPGVSQTVIISRSAGRTAVPEREEIRQLAVHQATMVLYLSAGQMEKLQKELLAGGYPPETPAAIVYKATWPEERCLRCTVSELAETARKNGITKTALVIVGEVLGVEYERSKLYDPYFSTEYRPAKETAGTAERARKKASLIAFTRQGTELAGRIANLLEKDGWTCEAFTTQKSYGRDGGANIQVLQESLREWTGKHFADSRALIFVGAAGIAVRQIAPYIKDKMTDPAVLVIDEAARRVIPLLSGHLGGANRLARRLSDLLGAECVLTTATDVRQRFAVDSFAQDNGLAITDRTKAKAISAAILDEKTIQICAPEGWLREEEFPAQLGSGDFSTSDELCVRIDWRCSTPGEAALRLIPEKSVWIGAGCKKGTTRQALEKAFEEFMKTYQIDRRALAGIASISLKKEEAGLLDFADAEQLPLRFFEAEQMEAVEGDFTDSAFVREQTGTGNVCERAACLAAQEEAIQTGNRPAQPLGCRLIVRKQTYAGITFAAALTDRRIRFE